MYDRDPFPVNISKRTEIIPADEEAVAPRLLR